MEIIQKFFMSVVAMVIWVVVAVITIASCFGLYTLMVEELIPLLLYPQDI